ncbi:glycerol-3-phosphate 1-O-acyltransferase PlsY [Williamsoniiplasma lucivorax]|uniref:Glycerol-3-phosphate acyltransferase n=1 Tax=Williamsoniiplasma lucivorax TaxID=209274 RepID=A0A2S5RCW8_9MOLU|nr:glycerol-3-phosphate 1-O-acyltransferase PlsY [Williamsoniiplasma lucivorax]PPE05164.1 glycerol-3-phosphate acyltransferase PlsY [Williamsoniiplasma lucivorax]
MYYLGIILASIFGYLIGSISFSIIVVKFVKGIDIRNVGSGNAGATNTTRELGKFWGLVVALLDGSKSIATALIAVLFSMIPHPLFSQTSYFIPILFVLIGHCYPIYYKFKGGKAVSSFLGLLFVANLFYFIFFLIVWFIVVYIWRKVSLASIVGAFLTCLIVIWLPWMNALDSFQGGWNAWDQWQNVWSSPWLRFSWFNYLHQLTNPVSGHYFAENSLAINIIILIGMFITAYRHFPNMIRLKNHKEPKTFPNMTKEDKQKYKIYIHDRSKKQKK